MLPSLGREKVDHSSDAVENHSLYAVEKQSELEVEL
jgi:hypothetical protein